MNLSRQNTLQRLYTSRLLVAVTACFCFFASSLQAQNVSCSVANKVYSVAGQKGKAHVLVTNWNRQEVKTISFTLTSEGTTSSEQQLSLTTPLKYQDTDDITIDVPAGNKPGVDDFTINITKVNGEFNRNVYPMSSSQCYTLTRPVWRKAVVEDLTGMWCPNCPTGIASLEHLNKVAANRVIGLAAHDGDVLNAGDYYDVFRKYPGRPKIILNGAHVVAPYYGNSGTTEQPFGLLTDVEKASGAQSAVELKVQAAWTDHRKGIEVRSITTFRCPIPENKYRLAYVLTADNLKRPNFYQHNNATADPAWKNSVPEMKFFYDAGGRVQGLPFNDVVFAATGILKGIEGSLPQEMPLDAPYVHTQHYGSFSNLTSRAFNFIKKDTKVHAVVLVIDPETREIINAERCEVGDSFTPFSKGPVTPPNVARIEMPATVTQPLNSEFTLQAKTFPKEATSAITWEVADAKVIKSLGDGKFRALKVGETTITARAKDSGGVTAKCVVRVPAPNVARIEIPATLTQPLNSEFTLTAMTFPKEVTSAITWEVADAKIIESLGGGKFRALKVGETTITARAQDVDGVTAKCVVRVPAPKVARIEIPATLTQPLNSEFALQAKTFPQETTSDIVWEVADTKVIESLGGGKFRALKVGETTITARAQDADGVIAKCVVRVPAPNVARIEMPTNLTQPLNSEFTLTAKTFPKEATSAITWEVADSKIVASLGGGKFRALKVGETTITVRAKDAGGVTAICVVRVPAPHVARIEIPANLTQPLNSEFTLQTKTFPKEATSDIVWEVADSKIVASLGGGKFRALKVGETTITVRAKDAGGVTAICVVRVPAPNVARIEIPATLTQPLNSEFTLTAMTFPKEATSAITWEVADVKVIKSLGGGKFRALKVGETTITARAKDAGGVTAICVVRVPAPHVARIEIPANLTQPLNSEFTLQMKTFPQEATSAIVWEVADSKIIESLGGGKFRALKVGETTITVRAQDADGMTSKCVVTVIAPTAIVSHTIPLVVYRNNTTLLIEEAPVGLPVVVYDLLGRKLASGRTNVSTTRLRVGDSPLWIVVVGNRIYRLKQ